MADVIKADLDEMVFQHRNKEYGSYVLRKLSNRITIRAFIFASLFIAFCLFAPLIAQLIRDSFPKDPEPPKQKVTYADLGAPPDVDQKKPPPPPPDVEPPPPPRRAQVRFVPPEVKKDDEVKPEETIVNIDTLTKTNVDVGKENVEGDPNAIFNVGEVEGTGTGPVEITEDSDPDPKVFVPVEKMPAPVNMAEFKSKIGYPEMAREAGIQGKVVVRILVDKEGNYSKHVVLKSPNVSLTNAVVNNLNLLKFTPGIQGGKPIKVWVTVPVDFKLGS